VRRPRVRSVFGIVLGGLAACAAHEPEPHSTVEAVEAVETARARGVGQTVIAKLRTRDRELTVFSSAGMGATFLVATIGGATVSDRLDAAELQASFPELHRLYQTAYVEAHGLDASVELERFEVDGRALDR
jgi:hypothetical protein